MRQTLGDFGYNISKVPLLCDNESAICLADNPIEHIRTKHIDIWHHFLRDHQQRGDIDIFHVSIDHQLADIFTMTLDERRFCELRSELNILDSWNLDWSIAYMCLYAFDHVLLSLIMLYCIFWCSSCRMSSPNLTSPYALMHILWGGYATTWPFGTNVVAWAVLM
jgi:hypothetical protein